MKRKYLYMLLLLALQACGEKIWYDDLREKTIDTFCGTYRIVSAEWEGDPIDLNGDGIPSTDYYTESGAENNRQTRFFSNGSALLRLPMTWASPNYDGSYHIYMSESQISLTYDIIFEKEEPCLSFNPHEYVADISVTGYGTIEARVRMTAHYLRDGLLQTVTAPVYFKLERIQYHK